MSFRLEPKSVTLSDLERRRNGVILRCFSEFGYLTGALRKSSRSLSHLLFLFLLLRKEIGSENVSEMTCTVRVGSVPSLISINQSIATTDLAGVVGPRAELEFAALLVERVVGDVDNAHRVEHACQSYSQHTQSD